MSVGALAEILFVGKPLAPPWNDGSKNLARDLAESLTAVRPVVLGHRDGGFTLSHGEVEPLFAGPRGGFGIGKGDYARVLKRLMLGRRPDLVHFFFAPNRKSSTAARIAVGARRLPSVQTVASTPTGADPTRDLFADVVVVLSRSSERLLRDAGWPAERLARIAPTVPPIPSPGRAAIERTRERLGLRAEHVIVYPGDLEIGGGAAALIDALPHVGGDAQLVVAARRKTAAAADAEADLRRQATARGVADRVVWAGEVDDIFALLAAATVVSLPSTDLRAKVDLPIVLLESMALERAVVVARGAPPEELADGGAAVAVAPRPKELAEAIAALLSDPDRRQAIGRAARDRVRDRHDPAGAARAYEAIYDRLLASVE